ncbi:hypothetical protein GCM10009850_094340 [Nonomuraea monospora]|uniref:Uncharacterized protein n=1 Tax=Nonomuraea monospora TaxID=568818 RepID=A0ABN3CWT2_9ACTN
MAVQEGAGGLGQEAFVTAGAPGRANPFELLTGSGEDHAWHGQPARVVPAGWVRGGAAQGDRRWLLGIEFASHMTTVRAQRVAFLSAVLTIKPLE